MKAAMNAPRALFIGHSYIDVTFLTDHIPRSRLAVMR